MKSLVPERDPGTPAVESVEEVTLSIIEYAGEHGDELSEPLQLAVQKLRA